MAWTTLMPRSKSKARIRVSAAVSVSAAGVAKITLWLSGALYAQMSKGKRVHVSYGSDEDVGCVHIDFCDDGLFHVSGYVNHGGRITIPAVPGVPDKSTRSHPCRIVEQSARVLVVRLPVDLWAQDEGRKIAPSAKPVLALPPVARVSVQAMPYGSGRAEPIEDNRIEVAAWLKKWGHDVKPLANGRFQVDGELKTPPQILHLINVQRAKERLPPIFIADLRFPG